MKNAICTTLYFILITGFPLIFTINGFGVKTWQWWTLTLGIFLAYIIGMARMV